MTSAAIAKLLDSYLTDVEGRPGFWRGMRDEVMVYVFSDDSHDRMRIMAPIGELREVEPRTLQVLLQANYDRALDARYALRGREVWAVTVHPLATLAPDDFAEFIEQTVKLVHNTGTTYASSNLMFQSPPGEEDGEDGEGNGDGDDDNDAAPSEEPEEPAQ